MPTKQKRVRGFPFTVHSWDDEVAAAVAAIYEDNKDFITYLIIGWEKGDTGETKHLQCYLYTRNPIIVKTMKDFIQSYVPEAHVEYQKSKTNVAAYCYCAEEGDWIEFGNRPRQGHRTDLEWIRYLLDNGTPVSQIKKEYFSQWVYHRRAFAEYAYEEQKVQRYDTKLYIYNDLNYDETYYVNRIMMTPRSYMFNWVECTLSSLYQKLACGEYDKVFISNTVAFIDKIVCPYTYVSDLIGEPNDGDL